MSIIMLSTYVMFRETVWRGTLLVSSHDRGSVHDDNIIISMSHESCNKKSVMFRTFSTKKYILKQSIYVNVHFDRKKTATRWYL